MIGLMPIFSLLSSEDPPDLYAANLAVLTFLLEVILNPVNESPPFDEARFFSLTSFYPGRKVAQLP